MFSRWEICKISNVLLYKPKLLLRAPRNFAFFIVRIAFFPPYDDKGFANQQSFGLVTLKLLDKSGLEGAILLVARAHQNLSGACKNLTWSDCCSWSLYCLKQYFWGCVCCEWNEKQKLLLAPLLLFTITYIMLTKSSKMYFLVHPNCVLVHLNGKVGHTSANDV